jgi:hypothetical protein
MRLLSPSAVDSKDELTTDSEPALKYFLAQYEKMLGENLVDYEENFDQYLVKTSA